MTTKNWSLELLNQAKELTDRVSVDDRTGEVASNIQEAIGVLRQFLAERSTSESASLPFGREANQRLTDETRRIREADAMSDAPEKDREARRNSILRGH